jgi:putative transposase
MPDSLEQLDLLLLTVAKPRMVQLDGIHFQGLRYLDLTLSAYIGEPVVIRDDPADLAEIRVYHQNRFLWRAVCQELAGQTISLKDIVQARTQRRRQVRDDLKEREKVVGSQAATSDSCSGSLPRWRALWPSITWST